MRVLLAVSLVAVCMGGALKAQSAAEASGQPPQAVRRVARVSGAVIQGLLLTKVPPVYPPAAKKDGIEGTVVLHAIIGKDGIIANLVAISGPDRLKDAALDAVRQWTYRPYLLNGEPTEVDTTVIVNFTLARPITPN